MKNKLVQSINPFQSVIQTRYDNVKVDGVEWKVETLHADSSEQAGEGGRRD